jgi:hypothetical protein
VKDGSWTSGSFWVAGRRSQDHRAATPPEERLLDVFKGLRGSSESARNPGRASSANFASPPSGFQAAAVSSASSSWPCRNPTRAVCVSRQQSSPTSSPSNA